MRIISDIEVYRNFFCVGFLDYDSGEHVVYEISERKNESNEIRKVLKNTSYLIGFNSIHYDDIHLFKIYKENVTNEELFNLTQEIIEKENYSFYKQWKYVPKDLKLKQIDLFLYWSKMLRQSKMLSLKSLAVQLNHDNIQELPYKPGSVLTEEQMNEVIRYNINDLLVTKKLLNALKEEVNLRIWIKNEYAVNCLSYDAPKIASEILANDYAKVTNSDSKSVKSLNFAKPSIHIEKLIEDIDFKFELSAYQNLYKKMQNSWDHFAETVYINHLNTTLLSSYGIGGLHSVNKNETYKSSDYQIVTSDIASLYPTLYLTYNCIRFPELKEKLTQIKNERIEAKRTKNKTKDTFLKLVLNSLSGLLDNTYSWLYYPEGALRMRILGQLILTVLTEKAILKGYKVISQNTDGIELIIHKSEIENYYQIVKEVEDKYKVTFEHDFYKKIVYSSVNDYIAITESGKLKKKGLFVTEPVLGNSTDFLVISKALEAYFVNGIQPEVFVKNHKNIFDFCSAKKIAKSFQVIWNGKIQQQLNRFYVSKKGAYLYKKKDNKNMENVLKGYGVMIYNKHEEKPFEEYHVNYQYYINEVKKIIVQLEPPQSTLF